MKRVLIAVVLLGGMAWAAEEEPIDQCVADPSRAAFRIFQTKNIWTFLKLNTATGQVWQVQWGDNFMVVPVNKLPLVKAPQSSPGRFTLCPTKNIFNFVLLDQDDGRMWGVQWSQEEKSRFITPFFFIDPDEVTAASSPAK